MSAAFCAWVLLCVIGIQLYSNDKTPIPFFSPIGNAEVQPADSPAPPKITNELRYTTMGWQNPSHWARQNTQAKPLSIVRLHPVIFALAVLLACLFAIVIDSPDDEVERLITQTRLRATRPRPVAEK